MTILRRNEVDYMERITIEYDIDYEKHLKNLFPEKVYDKIAEEILNDSKLKHIIYSQIGHDEEHHGRLFHVVERYKIYDVERKEYLSCNDERLEYGLKKLMWICQDHYTDRNDKELLENNITWKIKTETI